MAALRLENLAPNRAGRTLLGRNRAGRNACRGNQIRAAGPGTSRVMACCARRRVDWLDLAFHEIAHGIGWVPGDYAPPRGVLLVAVDGPRYLAMIALRPFDHSTAK